MTAQGPDRRRRTRTVATRGGAAVAVASAVLGLSGAALPAELNPLRAADSRDDLLTGVGFRGDEPPAGLAVDGRTEQTRAEQAAALSQLAAKEAAAPPAGGWGTSTPSPRPPVRGPGGVPVAGDPAAGAPGVAVQFAMAQLGLPYLWGAVGPNAYDCSGLMQTAYKTAGIQLPRTSVQQATVGTSVGIADLKPGDLMFWAYQPADLSTVHHVAMYIGNGMVVHAPDMGDVVKVAPIWLNEYAGAVRVAESTGAVPTGAVPTGAVPTGMPTMPSTPAPTPSTTAPTSTSASPKPPPGPVRTSPRPSPTRTTPAPSPSSGTPTPSVTPTSSPTSSVMASAAESTVATSSASPTPTPTPSASTTPTPTVTP